MLKNKKIFNKLVYFIVFLLVLFTLGDIITTMIAYFTMPIFNETNPIGNIWLLFGLKILFTLFIIHYLLRKYNTTPTATIRYYFIYFVSIILLLNGAVVINNINVLNTPHEQLEEIPKEVKTEIYKEQVYDLGLVKPKNNKVPFLFVLFGINLYQFLIWRIFENERKRKLCN